jgi:putative oxidoreductase
MLKKIVNTENDYVALMLRLALGYVFFFHGMQKLTTMFGGYGYTGTMGFFTQKLGVPAVFAFLAIMAEGRIAAFGITVNMIVAVKMLHFQNGIFMNWFGNQKGEGYEYHILAIAIGIALMIKGGGALSVDRALTDKK